jgi:hypothetical protein
MADTFASALIALSASANHFGDIAFSPHNQKMEIAMRRTTMLAVACFGAFVTLGTANAAPISAAGALNGEASRAAIGTAIPDATVQDVRWHGRWHRPHHRHWGWHPHRHWGWRHRWHHHRYAWYPRRHVW